jgi:hypothetical protein
LVDLAVRPTAVGLLYLEEFMETRTCDHLKEDGFYCKSPALRGRDYCYFHLKLRGRRLNMARARALAADQPLDLPFPEDMHSVQVTLFEVVNALVNKRIDHKTAGLALYAMQQASINLNNRHESQGMCQSVKPDAPMLALEFRDFEQQYHLPKRIDLEADPETALQEAGALPQPPSVDTTPGEQTGGSPSPALGNCAVTSTEQKSARKRRKHRRRGDRVPLPKGLWKVVDPDAPFRAYTSDGRELTREDAKRWQQRVWAEMQAFVEHGGAPGWDKDIA